MNALLAQAAQTSATADDGVSYALILTIIAVEATLSGLTWAAFNAEARLQKERDSDIRDAEAGQESGRVLPAVAALIETVLEDRRHDEPVRATLDRSDAWGQLQEVIDAAAQRTEPRAAEQRLIKAWTVVGAATVAVQVSGPVMLLNHAAGKSLISDTAQTVAGVALIGGVAIMLVAIIVVRQFARSLSRSIKSGKDAARVA